ncbi:MAG: LapA family protein [Actinomycetota bacterium]|nr:LapA family protein [Acidimicrobiia bacterium]MDQ3468498.1 LapA family protein [Actinomycetota bacterium]
MYESNDRREADDRRVVESRSGISPALIGFVVIAIIAVVFIIQNANDSRVNILFWDVTASLWLVIAVSIVIGILLDRLFGIWWRRRRRG